MSLVMVKFFGKKAMVPHETWTNGKKDPIPKIPWDEELWIERGEDWYALDSYRSDKIHKKYKKKYSEIITLVVRREDFLNWRVYEGTPL